ncbi:type VI secretion lipoprotein TssJ [Hafnia alvei]|uniref:type VI secretion lipoprotein TssJ n=1 Tax=Hafnia alvei TaxID=569 RepID=UPI001E477775|nr:type VI secretion lipoprotein TssJ [Hafnia alvei]
MLGVIVFTGCSASHQQAREQAIDAVSAPFASGAITLQLRAEPGLNNVNDLPNSCTVLLVQTKDKTTLDKVLSNPVTLKSLFAGAGGEGDVLQVDRYVVMPGQSNTLHIDRALNTRSVAFVAGYYPFPTKQHMLSMDIPVETQSSGWLSPVWHASLAPVTMTVTLGSETIVNANFPTQSASAARSIPATGDAEDKQ